MIRRALALLLLAATPAFAQEAPPIPPWSERPPPQLTPAKGWKPIVPLRFDRFYTLEELHQGVRDVAAAWPSLVQVQRIGTTVEGREILVAVVTDRATGADDTKTAFWCDGNIHGNEVQAGETCLYTIWWLCENYSRLPRVKKLLQERTLYICPSLNPDGRAHWFDAPNTMHSSRSGKRPVDNDRDGRFDEDPPNDIDGDGELLQMRVADPNGEWKDHPEEPRLMVRVKPGERGTYRMLGQEGIDDDGDGRVNEDGPGGYDPNRDWPSDWRGPAEQYGAGPYPASLPETRAVIDFLLAHPNVAGFQSFHNTGGMILRGPGSKSSGEYPRQDDQVMQAIAKRGEEQLPFYRSMVLWKDLYQVYGGEVNFAYEGLGIIAFTNELWSRDMYHKGQGNKGEDGRLRRLQFDDDLEFGARYAAWKPFVHPTHGSIELGGWRKQTGRVPPPFMLQEGLHRNMAFVLYHADQMPLVTAGSIGVKRLGAGLSAVTATFENSRMIPTRTEQAAKHALGRADIATLTGNGLEVVTVGIVDRRTDRITKPQLRRPDRLRLPGGIPGNRAVQVRWIVRGTGEASVTYDAEKGGSATLTVRVQ